MTGRIRVTTIAPLIVVRQIRPVGTALRRAIAGSALASQVPRTATFPTHIPHTAKSISGHIARTKTRTVGQDTIKATIKCVTISDHRVAGCVLLANTVMTSVACHLVDIRLFEIHLGLVKIISPWWWWPAATTVSPPAKMGALPCLARRDRLDDFPQHPPSPSSDSLIALAGCAHGSFPALPD